MQTVFASLPLVAMFLAVPQFLPQLSRARRGGTTAGVSWSWAALTSVNNAAWLGYFALSGFWTAFVPATSATVLSGQLAVVLARRGGPAGQTSSGSIPSDQEPSRRASARHREHPPGTTLKPFDRSVSISSDVGCSWRMA